MKNFLKLAAGVDVMGALAAVYRKPELWGGCPVRSWHQQSAARQEGLADIILRYNKFNPSSDDYVEAVCSSIEVENYPAWVVLPEVQALLWPLMLRVQGLAMGRVFVAKLAAGASIPPHSDRIALAEEAFPLRQPPAAYYDRYHIVLESNPGVVFRCGEEQVYMDRGEVWWFNNQLEHEVVNNSGEDRVHLIVDIHSAGLAYSPAPYGKAGPEG